MTWIDLAVAGALTAAVVVLPGIVLALVMGLRGLASWAAAFPFGVTVISTASVAAPLIGLAWSPLPVVLVTVVFAAVIGGVRLAANRGWRLRAPQPVERGRWVIAAVVAAGIVVAAQVVVVIGAPDNISQTFDNIFHLNAVRYALDNGNASPLFVGSMTSTSGGMWFYPTAWHATAALVVQATGASIPVAANAMALVFSALAWPAGAMWLTSELFGRGRGTAIGAGLAIIGSASFPLLMIDYGVLYPLHMGLAVLPAALALALRALRITSPGGLPAALAVVGTLGTLPGLAVAHPGALVAWIVFVSVGIVFTAVRAWKGSRSRGQRALVVVFVAAYAIVAAAVWWVLRPPAAARTWQPEMTVAQAMGEVSFASPYRAPLALLVAVLMIAGVVWAVRSRRRAPLYAVVALLAVGGLYVVVAALPYFEIRDVLTGSWYNNLPRVAAILPTAVVPLAGAGALFLSAGVRGAARRMRLRGPLQAIATAGVLLIAVVAALLPMRTPIDTAQANYTLDADSPLVSADEMALMRRLDDEVEPDAVIAGSPWTGAGLAYAISGREVLQPHTLMDITSEMTAINDGLDRAAPGGTVCRAVDDTRVRYVLDFGTREVHGGNHPYPGFSRLAASKAVELVDEEGDARLYRIVGCAR